MTSFRFNTTRFPEAVKHDTETTENLSFRVMILYKVHSFAEHLYYLVSQYQSNLLHVNALNVIKVAQREY